MLLVPATPALQPEQSKGTEKEEAKPAEMQLAGRAVAAGEKRVHPWKLMGSAHTSLMESN